MSSGFLSSLSQQILYPVHWEQGLASSPSTNFCCFVFPLFWLRWSCDYLELFTDTRGSDWPHPFIGIFLGLRGSALLGLYGFRTERDDGPVGKVLAGKHEFGLGFL